MTDHEPPRCGRPTRSGKPCQQQVWRSTYGPALPFEVACGVHTTADEKATREAACRWWNDGRQAGLDEGERDRERLQAKIDKAEEVALAKIDEALRVYGEQGNQLVEVGGYAYRWTGCPPLRVGDRVRLPANWLFGVTTGTVTAMGSVWKGDHATILERLSPAEIDG